MVMVAVPGKTPGWSTRMLWQGVLSGLPWAWWQRKDVFQGPGGEDVKEPCRWRETQARLGRRLKMPGHWSIP